MGYHRPNTHTPSLHAGWRGGQLAAGGHEMGTVGVHPPPKLRNSNFWPRGSNFLTFSELLSPSGAFLNFLSAHFLTFGRAGWHRIIKDFHDFQDLFPLFSQIFQES